MVLQHPTQGFPVEQCLCRVGIYRSNLISLQKKIRDKTAGVLNLQKATIQKIITGSIIMARGGDVI